jgi:hypothetical protein
MTIESPPTHHSSHPPGSDSVEMPRPTIAPLVLAVGMLLLASSLIFGLGFLIAGAVLILVGLGLWIAQLLPGQGHMHEAFVDPAQRPRPISGLSGGVARLLEGMPGHRLRMPEKVHPISAGIKGGLAGGAVMPIPAILWALFSGHSIFYPLNLLVGTALPHLDPGQLDQFNVVFFIVGLVIHASASLVLGLIYGVLMPTLPSIHRAIAWGGLLMPLLWSGTTFLMMSSVSQLLRDGVSWPWFIFSQFLFGTVLALFIMRYRHLGPIFSGIGGGFVGGLLMPLPALIWALASGHSIWYPGNLLAGMILSEPNHVGPEALERLHTNWLMAALTMHVVMCSVFGIAYAFVLPKLPPLSDPAVWGGIVLPLLWTGSSYGLMGVLNPALQTEVSWPWFVVSQFVFGIAAAVVVHRSEMIHIPPAGSGPDRVANFVTGRDGGQS